MLIERLFGTNPATRLAARVFVHGKAAVEDPDTGAGDSYDDEETGLAATEEDIAALRGEEDEDELDRENERAKAEARGETVDDSEPETTTAKRKHRFQDHEAAEEGFTELQRHSSRVEQENAQLREQLANRDLERESQPAKQTPAFEMNEAEYLQMAEQVNEEYTKLPPEKRNLVGATSIMARMMMERMAKVAESAASKTVLTESERARLRQEAEANCKSVMKETGLDPELHFDLLIMQRDRLNREQPNWIRGLTPTQQFETLSQQTAGYLKRIGAHTRQEVSKAKAEHNREAGATLDGGSRSSASSRQGGRDDRDDDRNDTMGADLTAHRASLRRRGTQQFQLMRAARR